MLVSRNNIAVIALKGAAFVPIVALVYFSDFGSWINYLVSSNTEGFLVGALALFGAGAYLKKEMIETYLQTSRSSLLFGSLALASAVAVYLYGSFFLLEPVFHFESLILLAVSYILFRTDDRLVRLLGPLFAIVGIAFCSKLIISGLDLAISSLLHVSFTFLVELYLPPVAIAIILLCLFASYTNPWYVARSFKVLVSNTFPRTWVVPTLISLLALAFWFVPSWIVLIATPMPLLLFAPPRLRSQLLLPDAKLLFRCTSHTPGRGSDGYCVVCGSKFSAFKKMPGQGFVGLAIVVVIVIALLLAQFPILILNSGTPYRAQYSFTGVNSQELPGSSSAWLVNSSTALSNSQDLYAARLVYVPSYHPESRNYTVYYELANVEPLLENSWGNIFGWNRSSEQLSVEGFTGSLVTYTSNSSLMMVYAGTLNLNFYSSSAGFQRLVAGVSIERNFTGVDQGSASSQFTADINSGLGAVLGVQSDYSGWTDFVQKAIGALDEFSSILIIGVSSLGIALGAYYVQDYDLKVDSLLTRSSDLDDIDWQIFSAMLKQNSPGGLTTAEIASLAPVLEKRDYSGLLELARILEKLEERRFIRRTYSERNGELLLTWKVLV